ncbi:MAG: 23S rRNA (adenine(2503)-C(2))-methyltransferase RlmN [bacterium]
MDIEKIQKFFEKKGEPKYRISQIKKAFYKDGILNFDKITTIPKHLRDSLIENFKILSIEEKSILPNIPFSPKKSRANETKLYPAKALLRLNDMNIIETVLLPNENGWTCCISTQAGCPLGCKFCATGKMGFKRNLTSEEITDQILYWRAYINDDYVCRLRSEALSNIVYMGMGEPFLNWKNTKKSLEDLINKNLFGYGSRSISVSTAGIPEGIINFAKNFPQMNLAISLHSANDKKRSDLMPINKKYGLFDLKNAIIEYFKITNRKIFMEYLMLATVNDSLSDAEELKNLIISFPKKNLLHVNLIPYNETDNEFKPSQKNQIKKFEEYLLKNKIHTTIRKSLGKEIKGACGQLGLASQSSSFL